MLFGLFGRNAIVFKEEFMRLAMCAVRTVFVFCLFIGNTAAENHIFDSDVRIIDSDESGITFTYSAPETQFMSIEGYPENY